jgi:hypothetical protein
MPIPLGIFATAGAGGAAAGAFELITTTLLSTTATTVTFSSIPQTYKHLQIRVTLRTNQSSVQGFALTYANGNNGSPFNKSSHQLIGNGSTVSSGYNTDYGDLNLLPGATPGNNASAGIFGATIIDVLDYTSTVKNKTFKSLGGYVNSGSTNNDRRIGLYSGLWNDLTTISSITISASGASFVSGCRFSLYGIKG